MNNNDNVVDINDLYGKLMDSTDIKEEDINSTEDKESYKLTEENINDILKTTNEVLESNSSLKLIADLPSNNGILENDGSTPGEYKEAIVSINHATGERSIDHIKSEDDIEKDDYLTGEFEDLLNGSTTDEVEDIELQDSVIEKNIKEKFDNISPLEISQFITLVKRFKECEKFNYFEAMPQSMKNEINETISEQHVPINEINSYRKNITTSLLKDFISDASLDQCGIDLQDQLNKIFEDAGEEFKNLYNESMNDKFEYIDDIIEKMREKGTDEDKINTLKNIKGAIIESSEYTEFKKSINKIKIKKFDLEKPERTWRSFNAKYENSKYNIYNIAMTPDILVKHVGCSKDDAVRFSLIFCKYCQNYDPSDVVQHTFMYYFILNIITLNINTPNKVYDDYSKTIIDNIKEIISNFRPL